MGINHVLDSIEVDNPTSASGFSSTVKGEGSEEGGEGDGDEIVKTTTVRAGGRGGAKGNIDGFINSGKMRGGATGRGGARGAGAGTGGRGGTTIINRKPPPTPSKSQAYDDGGDGGDGDGDSYE
jgi:hypothetical protein